MMIMMLWTQRRALPLRPCASPYVMMMMQQRIRLRRRSSSSSSKSQEDRVVLKASTAISS
jgi:hypothetical protein